MKRWYVSLTWDNWPEGGSYGTVVWAHTHDEAVTAARCEMADLRDDAFYETEAEAREGAEQLLLAMRNDWHVVDCFDLDAFIDTYKKEN